MYGELYHHGIKGMHWGIRRYQNEDGTLTKAGRARYGSGVKELKDLYRKEWESGRYSNKQDALDMATAVYLDRISKKENKTAGRTDKTLKIVGVTEAVAGLAGATANGLGPDLVRTGVSGGLMVSGILTYVGSSSIAGKRLVKAKRKGLETVQHALKEINNEEVEDLKNNITYFGYK